MTCANVLLVKDEQRYLKEWLDFHVKFFSHIFVIEDFESKSHKKITDSFSCEKVSLHKISEYVEKKTCIRQIELQQKMKKLLKGKFDFFTILDVDEFLDIPEDKTLNDLLELNKDSDAIRLCYLMMNANGHIKRPEGNVRDNYTHELTKFPKYFNYNYKDIMNLKKDFKQSFHGSKTAVFADGSKVKNNGLVKEGYLHSNGFWIKHYYTKSLEDWKERLKKGNVIKKHDMEEFYFFNPSIKRSENYD